MFLTGTEGDDAAHRIIGRHANGDAVAGDNFDAEPPHAAAQLGQHLVALIALHPVQAATMDSDHGALNIDEIVLTQLLLNPFNQRLCHIVASVAMSNVE